MNRNNIIEECATKVAALETEYMQLAQETNSTSSRKRLLARANSVGLAVAIIRARKTDPGEASDLVLSTRTLTDNDLAVEHHLRLRAEDKLRELMGKDVFKEWRSEGRSGAEQKRLATSPTFRVPEGMVLVPRGYLDVVQGVLEECEKRIAIPDNDFADDFALALAQTNAHLTAAPAQKEPQG